VTLRRLLAAPALIALYLATVAATSLVVAPPRLDPDHPHAGFVTLAARWEVDAVVADRRSGRVELLAHRGEGGGRRERRATIPVEALDRLLREPQVQAVLAHRPGVVAGLRDVALSGMLARRMDPRAASAAPSPARR
jgi:hypothetical protein